MENIFLNENNSIESLESSFNFFNIYGNFPNNLSNQDINNAYSVFYKILDAKRILDYYFFDNALGSVGVRVFLDKDLYSSYVGKFTNSKVKNDITILNNNIFIYAKFDNVNNFINDIYNAVIKRYINYILDKLNIKLLWFKEGLKDYCIKVFSNPVAHYQFPFKNYLISEVLRKDLVIPDFNDLEKDDRNSFNVQNDKYNGVAIGFFIIDYMISRYPTKSLSDIVLDVKTLDEIHNIGIKNIIDFFIKKYNITNKIYDENAIITPVDVIQYLHANVAYGYIDINGEKHYDSAKGLRTVYKVNSIDEAKKNNLATCIEYTKIAKSLLEKIGYNTKIVTRFYKEPDEPDSKLKIHCICIFQDGDGKWYRFNKNCESDKEFVGYDSIQELIDKQIQLEWEGAIHHVVEDLPDGLTFDELISYINNFNIDKELKRELV